MCNGKLSSFILTTPFLYVVFCSMSFYITSNIDVGGGGGGLGCNYTCVEM